jgi:hypothetical protein
MPDAELHARITALADEEHALLRSRSGGGGLSPEEHARLGQIETALDKTWDLLRQREARRRAGLDPESAAERDTATVEGYLS